MTATLESARRDWGEGHRRFAQEVTNPRHASTLDALLEALLDELRRRIGQRYTLAELADAYTDSERWARTVAAERVPAPGAAALLTEAVDEAFHRFSRGALDYTP